MRHIVDIENIDFSYRKTPLFKGLNMPIPQNAVFGLLGPNGAGKTTLMKLIVGLLKPSAGAVRLFDGKYNSNEISRKTGALIGKAPMYENLSAQDNLRINAAAYGLGEEDIQRVIELTGLEISGNKRVKQFSTGMKQRLGIALAVLHNPDLILLDEPMNGLDPGMRAELKKIIHRLWKEGKTILISSHELSEVEKICTHVALINKGVCAFQGDIHSVFADQPRTVNLRVAEGRDVSAVCAGAGFIMDSDGNLTLPNDKEFARLIKTLTHHDIDILGIETKLGGLDHFFEKHSI